MSVDVVAVARLVLARDAVNKASASYVDEACYDDEAVLMANVVIAAEAYITAEDAALKLLLEGGKASDADVEAAFEAKETTRDALCKALRPGAR